VRYRLPPTIVHIKVVMRNIKEYGCWIPTALKPTLVNFESKSTKSVKKRRGIARARIDIEMRVPRYIP